MARSERFIRRASEVSQNTECLFCIGAVVTLGSRIISTGYCTKKTHPRNPKIKTKTKKKQLCAEVNAILKALRTIPKEKRKYCCVYVARRRNDGSLGLAKPCSFCQSFLKEVGIKNVYYTTNDGCIEYLEAA